MDIRIRSGRQAIAGTLLLFSLTGVFGLAGCSIGGDDPPATPTGSPVVLFDRSGSPDAEFSSPNGNISCGFAAGSGSDTVGAVRCEIVVKTWQPPAKPVSCNTDWGFGMTLDTRAAVLCAGDTVRGNPASVTLPYGTAMRFAPFTCSITVTAVDCVNTTNGAGFLLGRLRYQMRNP